MIEKNVTRGFFFIFLQLRKHRYVDIVPIYSRRSRVVQDLCVCFIRMFRMHLVNFMDNKSLQSRSTFFYNQGLLHLCINFKKFRERRKERNLKYLKKLSNCIFLHYSFISQNLFLKYQSNTLLLSSSKKIYFKPISQAKSAAKSVKTGFASGFSRSVACNGRRPRPVPVPETAY